MRAITPDMPTATDLPRVFYALVYRYHVPWMENPLGWKLLLRLLSSTVRLW